MPSQASQGGGSQQDTENEERVYRLLGGTMEVVSAGKKSHDAPFMTLDLLFKLDDRANSQVVGKL